MGDKSGRLLLAIKHLLLIAQANSVNLIYVSVSITHSTEFFAKEEPESCFRDFHHELAACAGLKI